MKLLKLCSLAFVFILAISFVSCSGDDDSSQPTNAELLANKWFLVKIVDISTTPSTEDVADACEANSYFDFDIDGTIIAEFFGLNGSDCESMSLEAANYIYSESNNQIVISEGSNSTIVTINTLTQTELVFTSSSQVFHFNR